MQSKRTSSIFQHSGDPICSGHSVSVDIHGRAHSIRERLTIYLGKTDVLFDSRIVCLIELFVRLSQGDSLRFHGDNDVVILWREHDT